MRLSDLVPPIVVNLARRSRPRQELYRSYEDALAVCRSGYEEDDLVHVVCEKTRLYRDRLLQQRTFVADASALRTLLGVSLARGDDELNVIDFGGACGAHCFTARAVFGDGMRLRWHVVETRKMVAKAVALADGQLKFFDDLQNAKGDLGRVDLLFSSGALQYVPRPYEFLELLTRCGARKLFITRVGLTTSPGELVIVQKSSLSANGPGPMPAGMRDGIVQYPATFARKDRFEAILSRNYSIDILAREETRAYQAAGHSIDTYGYFCSMRDDARSRRGGGSGPSIEALKPLPVEPPCERPEPAHGE